jgi:glycosyltransferase involved in cell wall biosynthesis
LNANVNEQRSPSQIERILLVHPTGNQNVRQAAQALNESGNLAGFYTTVAWNPESRRARLLPVKMQRDLGRRAYLNIPQELIHSQPWSEMMRQFVGRTGLSIHNRDEKSFFGVDAIYRRLDRKVARELRAGRIKPTAIYSYDDCALHCFKAAGELGIKRIFEQPTVYHRAVEEMIRTERELNPEWINCLSGVNDSADKLARKDEELRRADAVFVASSYCAATLKLFPEPLNKPVYTINYGSPATGPQKKLTSRTDPLRVLFVGSMNQRKGISYLFRAIEQLSVAHEFTLIGGLNPKYKCKPLIDGLGRFRWLQSLPHNEVLREMRAHDVLVFPTLSDAFGLVILEAMAQGTVVLTTPNSAACDVIEHGVNGLVVPVRDTDAITAQLTRLAEDRNLLYQLGEAGRRTAEERSWARYRAEWSGAIVECLQTLRER